MASDIGSRLWLPSPHAVTTRYGPSAFAAGAGDAAIDRLRGAIIERGMARERDQRIGGAGELADALRSLRGAPSSPPLPPTSDPAGTVDWRTPFRDGAGPSPTASASGAVDIDPGPTNPGLATPPLLLPPTAPATRSAADPPVPVAPSPPASPDPTIGPPAPTSLRPPPTKVDASPAPSSPVPGGLAPSAPPAPGPQAPVAPNVPTSPPTGPGGPYGDPYAPPPYAPPAPGRPAAVQPVHVHIPDYERPAPAPPQPVYVPPGPTRAPPGVWAAAGRALAALVCCAPLGIVFAVQAHRRLLAGGGRLRDKGSPGRLAVAGAYAVAVIGLVVAVGYPVATVSSLRSTVAPYEGEWVAPDAVRPGLGIAVSLRTTTFGTDLEGEYALIGGAASIADACQATITDVRLEADSILLMLGPCDDDPRVPPSVRATVDDDRLVLGPPVDVTLRRR